MKLERGFAGGSLLSGVYILEKAPFVQHLQTLGKPFVWFLLDSFSGDCCVPPLNLRSKKKANHPGKLNPSMAREETLVLFSEYSRQSRGRLN